MRRFIYITLCIILFTRCGKVENIGPILQLGDFVFFLEDSVSVRENSEEDILVSVGSIKGENVAEISLQGTALRGTDYEIKNDELSLIFSEGEFIRSLVVSLIDNDNIDNDKTIIFSLPEGEGYSENNRRVFKINIINDELSSGTIISKIVASEDDVEEFEDGDVSFSSSDLELGETSSGDVITYVGLIFRSIEIPKGANISTSNIQFYADEGGNQPVEMDIYGENIGNPVLYDSDNRVPFGVSVRTRTTEKVTWNVPAWVEGEQAANQNSPNLSAILKEIIDREDWENGNTISIIMKTTRFVNDTEGGREAATWDEDNDDADGNTKAPQLTIKWAID